MSIQANNPDKQNPVVPNYEISDTNAEKTIYHVGGKSRTTQRITFDKDSHYSFNAMVINSSSLNIFQKLHAMCWFTKVKYEDGKELWINTKSLCHRLLLTPEEIKALAATKDGLTLQWISDRIGMVKKAVELAKKDSAALEELYTTNAAAKSQLDLESVKYLSRHAWTIAHLNPQNPKITDRIEFVYKDVTYLAKLEKDANKMHILGKRDKTLGMGGYGVVYRVFDVTTGTYKVVKHYNRNAAPYKDQIIKNLYQANPDNTIQGLQPKPELVIGYRVVTKEFIPLDKFLTDKTVDKLLVCKGLANALWDLRHTAMMQHGDIKPANILIEKDDKGGFTVKLGDLDFATKLDTINKVYSYTTARFFFQESYISLNDGRALYEAIHKDGSKYKAATERHDIFAMGMTLFAVLSNNASAFNNRVLLEGHIVSGTFNKKALEGVDPKIIQLLEEMLDLDPAKRPTLENFKERADQLFKGK